MEDLIRTENALLIDSLVLFSKAFDYVSSISNFEIGDVGCSSSGSFLYGSTLLNFIKSVGFSIMSNSVILYIIVESIRWFDGIDQVRSSRTEKFVSFEYFGGW